ncbi:MAG: hypothetical protein EXS60_01445 [Candidatus Pacebacteria bacterium]|nr:hypothetical protein [Candidatus Paceibacterota bacterium]
MDRLRIIYKAFVGWVTPARFINIIFGILLVGSFISIVYATTPNPGHPWTELGDGVFKITGPTALRTFTFPDATSTVLTTNDVVTLAQGGTNANLTASNGGIFYSTDSAGAILSGTATAGQILRSGTSDAPSWSTATYPATSAASKYILTSDGTNFVSTAPDSMITTITRSYNATGASTTFSLSSNTSFRIGMFSVPASITVNQISILPGTITMNMGGLKICIYSGDGATKIIDQTTALPVASTILTTTISSPATLPPGNYYIAVGCVSSMCGSLNVTSFTSTSIAFENGATVPSGKMVYEGTGTMTAGTCNATLPTITGAVSSTVNARLDN